MVGKTDELGWTLVEVAVHVNDFQATSLHLFGLDHLKLTYPFEGFNVRLTSIGSKTVD